MSDADHQQLLAEHRAARLSDKKDVSGRIGETSRFIGFGLVALVFTIHGSSSELAKGIVLSNWSSPTEVVLRYV